MTGKPAQLTPEQAERLRAKGRADPVWWVRNVLGRQPWPIQCDIMEAVRDYPEVAVRACHGIGKDWTAAGVVLWFLYNHRPSIVITTGPTDRQVRGILWKEIGIAHARAKWPLGGTLLSQELKIARDWWAWGFTAPQQDPDRFQGFHEVNVLVVVDEASGVSGEIYTAIEGILTSENAHKLEIGNPTDPSSHFAKSFKTPGVKCFGISAFDTPNFTTFGITEDDIRKGTRDSGPWLDKIAGRPLPNPKLVTPYWVAARWHRWGEGSPFVAARIRGVFPDVGEDQLIRPRWIEMAQQRTLEPKERDPNILAVDVARFGSDSTVMGHRHGPRFRIGKRRWGQIDTMETAGRVQRALFETGATEARVDVPGVGGGVVDRLTELNKPVVPANPGAASSDPERFVNARAEWYWNLREIFEKGLIDIDPEDEELAAQLSSIRWSVDSKGRILIESKKDMKKRGVASPDDADTCAIAFAPEISVTDLEAMTEAMRKLMGG